MPGTKKGGDMNFWTGLHFFSFVIYTFAIFYVIVKNPYAAINWVLAMLFFYFALWSACSVVLDNTALDPNTAVIAMKIQSVGWASFTAYYFLFTLFLTNNKKIISLPLLFIAIIISPWVFVYQDLNGQVLLCCQKVYYGYAGTWAKTVWAFLYIIYYSVMFFGGSYLLFKYRNTTRIRAEKQMAETLLGSAIAVFLIGTVFTVIMNYMKIFNPVDANVVFLIFVAAFIYSVEKYETFTLSSTRNAESIMEIINEGIVLLDRDGSMTTANRAAMEIFGLAGAAEIQGSYEFIEKSIKRAGVVAEGKEDTNCEFTYIDAAGKEKTVLISSRIILRGIDSSGWVCSIRDITAKKNAETALVETVRELKRSNEDLESFAYVASHDLKEPLRMVTSYVQLIRKKFMDKLGNDGNDYINFAAEGSIRMSDLIEGLLDYSRIRRAGREYKVVSIEQVIKHVLNVMKFSIVDKKAEVEVKGILPSLTADKLQIEQLFQNIISNSLKFSGKDRPVITISAEDKGQYHEFIIKDNGIGIEQPYHERIFQIFQRLHSRAEYPGTGVGLAICKKIVETHGGKIRVESEGPGKGCSFIFTLKSQ